jgi:acetolactate synthase-1/2/3 large subunit
VAEVYRQADLVLAVGYDPVEFNYEDWLPDAPLIHVDNRPADVESEPAGGLVNLIGDPAGTLRRLAAEPSRLSAWGSADLARHRGALAEALTPPPGSFGPRAVLAALRDALPENGILTCDVGAHTHLIGQAWSANHPDELIMTNGWSSMGFGLPAAVAAKICRPDRPVAAVIGDGGFLMSAGELAAAARLKLGLVVVVLVDHGLSLIRVKQRRSGCEDQAVEGWPAGGLTGDRLFGAQLETARNLDELRGALQSGWNHQRPCVIQVFVDGREYHRLIARSHK